jgi:PTS system nitrogen regulatory IIA component
MKILDFLRYNGIIPSLEAHSKEEALAELVAPIVQENPDLDREGLIRTLIERENLGSTGIGGGVAIPHGKIEGLPRLVASFGKSQDGIDFRSMDNKPAFLFFLLVAPKNSAGEHLKALARISRLFRDPLLKTSLLQAQGADEIFQILEEYDLRLP